MRRKKTSHGVITLQIFIANLLECVSFWMAFCSPSRGIVGPLFFHVLASILIVFSLLSRGKHNDVNNFNSVLSYLTQNNQKNNAESSTRKLYALFGIFSFGIPFLGVPMLSILYITLKYSTYSSRKKLLERYYEKAHLLYKREKEPIKDNIQNELFRILDIEPVVDLINGPEKERIIETIELLAKYENKESVDLLREAMEKGDGDIKFYSSWGLECMEDSYSSKIGSLRKRISEKNDREVILEYIEVVFRFCESGLPDNDSRAKLLEDCREIIVRLLNKIPEDTEFMALAGIIQKLSGNSFMACQIFQRVIDKPNFPQKYLHECADAFFQEGNFEIVKKIMIRLNASADTEIPVTNNCFF
ncbi:MAG: hypothetical protein HQM10_10690 [Candidatus Riflebacteria bacterium]|nr:hypothetical protein [Candidatus Riflebacteria bacterium]